MNEITRIEPMAVRDKAIAHAGAFRAGIRSLERIVAKGIALAQSEGVPGVLDSLLSLKDKLADAHEFAADVVAPTIAAAMGDGDVTVYSGGTGAGKDEDAVP